MSEQDSGDKKEVQKDPNLAVVDRMRDLAKWLIVTFGAIGGVLIAGTELGDIGSAEGSDLALAILGVVLGVLGAGVALAFTVIVLLPTGISLSRLAKEEKTSEMGKRVREEPELLYGLGKTIGEFKRNAEHATDAQRAEADLAVTGFLNYAILYAVKRKMVRAVLATFAGGVLVVAGITLFSIAVDDGDGDSDGDTPAATVQASPPDPTAVSVALAAEGVELLAEQLGEACATDEVAAIAIEGSPNALQLVSMPTDECEAIRFTLTPNVGHVIADEDLQVLPTCDAKKPEAPCVFKE